MDDHVLRGMARWPDVPAVYGWLSLDQRGSWLLKDEPITNPVVTAYLARNYEHDGEGRWFFQNGPQRVYVELAYTPLVYRVVSAATVPLEIESHTGKRAATLHGAWMDEHGALLVQTEHGIGVVNDRDLDIALSALIDANGGALPDDALEDALALIEAGHEAPVWLKLGERNVKVGPIHSSDVPGRFGYSGRSPPRGLKRLRPLAELGRAAAQVRGVFCDIDDTLTTEGRLTAAAYAAMERLQDAGLIVVPVTGRPAGWCDHIARMWPVDGVVGENGAFYFRYDARTRRMHRRYVDDDATRARYRERLEAIAASIIEAVPGAALAADQHYRETDLAIDFCEDVPRLGDADISRIVALMESRGLTAKVSSIHVNGWFGSYDKLAMTRIYLRESHGVDLDASRADYVFVGDSPNDAPMFGFFPLAVGVANVKDFSKTLTHAPAFVTSARCGAGFAELADCILATRQTRL